MSDAVRAAQKGSEDSFRTLYRATQPPLLRYLRSLVGEDAEDVASEAWLQITRDLHTFRGDYDGFKAWATTIARHRAMDHLRRIRRRPADTVPNDEMVSLPAGDDTASMATDSVATDGAMRLIARLPRDQAEAILLRVVIGLDAKTAGKVLGKRAGAVRTAAYRGLRRLAKFLTEEESANHTPAKPTRQPAETSNSRRRKDPVAATDGRAVTPRSATTLKQMT
ncbi:MAG TPA: RNA polymerase sigma factor [Micromonosporaceae bacterium]|nr:RNA polymerase sigma factor [Micromonosporaceae bacterium]